MIKLKKPQFNQADIIDDCIQNMRDRVGHPKNRILASKLEICKKGEEYDSLAIKGELSTITEHDELLGGATKDDMVKLYNNKFVRKGEGGRKYYDAIKLLAPMGRCPFCGQRDVQTLDHYLPKSKYPAYAVTPYNLIPACSDCNHDKLESTFQNRKEETIHPYYDDFTDETWIMAKMVEEEPITFEFNVDYPKSWSDIKYQRAKNHFEEFNLNELYKPYACEEFRGCVFRLTRLFKKGGKELAIEHLEESIEEKNHIRLNTWQAAMYEAIIESDWFWNEYMPNQIETSDN